MKQNAKRYNWMKKWGGLQFRHISLLCRFLTLYFPSSHSWKRWKGKKINIRYFGANAVTPLIVSPARLWKRKMNWHCISGTTISNPNCTNKQRDCNVPFINMESGFSKLEGVNTPLKAFKITLINRKKTSKLFSTRFVEEKMGNR